MNNGTKIMVWTLLVISSVLRAQQRPDIDKIKSLKVAFITESLDLGSMEARNFWPIYKEYEDNREAIREREYNAIHGKIRDLDTLSEKGANNLIKQYLGFEEEEEELDNFFIERISKVISSKKTLLLLRSEYEFKKRLLKQYRNKKGNR